MRISIPSQRMDAFGARDNGYADTYLKRGGRRLLQKGSQRVRDVISKRHEDDLGPQLNALKTVGAV